MHDKHLWSHVSFVGIAVLCSVLAWTQDPFYYEPKEDSAQYHRLAKNLAENGEFSNQSSAPHVPSSRRTPGYPMFVASVYLFAGPSVQAVKLVQCLVFPPLIYLLAFGLASRLLIHRTAAQLTAIAIAILPALVGANNSLLTEGLFTVLLLATVLSLYRWTESGSTLWAVAFGGLCGSLTLTKPEAALFVAFGGFVVILLARHRLRAAAHLILALLICFLILMPWLVRNRVQFGQWKLQGGTAAEGGGDGGGFLRHYRLRAEHGVTFQPDRFKYFYGDQWKAEHQKYEALASATVADPDISDRAYWISNPRLLLKYSWVRFCGLLQPTSWSDGYGLADDFGQYWKRDQHFRMAAKLGLLFIDASIVLAGCVGLLFSLPPRFRAVWPVTVTVLYFVLVYSLLHGVARYRLPIVPLLVLLSVWLGVHLIQTVLASRRRVAVGTAGDQRLASD